MRLEDCSPSLRAKKLRWRAMAERYQASLAAKRRGSFSRADWLEILEIHDHRCAWCLRKAERLEADHVIALGRGGEHEPSNIVPACVRCNRSKKDRVVFYMLEVA